MLLAPSLRDVVGPVRGVVAHRGHGHGVGDRGRGREQARSRDGADVRFGLRAGAAGIPLLYVAHQAIKDRVGGHWAILRSSGSGVGGQRISDSRCVLFRTLASATAKPNKSSWTAAAIRAWAAA